MKVGDKVVCIRQVVTKDALKTPAVGEIYTVRDILPVSGDTGIRLMEIVNRVEKLYKGNKQFITENAFRIEYFRPVDYCFGEKIAEEICKTSEPEKQPAYANN